MSGIIKKPTFNCTTGSGVQYEIQYNVQEGIRCSIVATAFHCEEMAKVNRDVLVGIFTTNNCSSKDQIIWG
jgi:hypothetical protein